MRIIIKVRVFVVQFVSKISIFCFVFGLWGMKMFQFSRVVGLFVIFLQTGYRCRVVGIGFGFWMGVGFVVFFLRSFMLGVSQFGFLGGFRGVRVGGSIVNSCIGVAIVQVFSRQRIFSGRFRFECFSKERFVGRSRSFFRFRTGGSLCGDVGGRLIFCVCNLFQLVVGYEYQSKLFKYCSQVDFVRGFGGKFGVQVDRVDQVSDAFKELGFGEGTGSFF